MNAELGEFMGEGGLFPTLVAADVSRRKPIRMARTNVHGYAVLKSPQVSLLTSAATERKTGPAGVPRGRVKRSSTADGGKPAARVED